MLKIERERMGKKVWFIPVGLFLMGLLFFAGAVAFANSDNSTEQQALGACLPYQYHIGGLAVDGSNSQLQTEAQVSDDEALREAMLKLDQSPEDLDPDVGTVGISQTTKDRLLAEIHSNEAQTAPTALPGCSKTPTATATGTVTPTKTATATSSATATKTSVGTSTATPTGTQSATSTLTPTATSTGTKTPTATPTGTQSPTNTSTVTPTPTKTSTPTPTIIPTQTATATPTKTQVCDTYGTVTYTSTSSPDPAIVEVTLSPQADVCQGESLTVTPQITGSTSDITSVDVKVSWNCDNLCPGSEDLGSFVPPAGTTQLNNGGLSHVWTWSDVPYWNYLHVDITATNAGGHTGTFSIAINHS